MAVSASMPMQSVRVVNSATCGRGLVATSRFAPGHCILEELPHVYTLKKNKMGLFCDFCLKRCSLDSTLKKCTRCKYVSYCDKSCQIGDWARCHKQDCETLEKYPVSDIQLLSQIIRKQRQSPPCTQDDEDCFPTTVDQLESHHEKLSDTIRNEFESLLFLLKQIIEEDDLPEPSSLLKMFRAIRCNNFSIYDNDLIVIAIGIFLRASLLNHSCGPNCIVVFDGRKLQLRTIKDVKEGEEFTISYLDFIIKPAKERRAELEEKYHFTCKCVKCLEEINALGPDDGLGEELRGLKKSWEQIQDAKKPQDWTKDVLQLCEPYLKPMDSSSSIPANHHLLFEVRYSAFNAFMDSQEFVTAAEIGQLNTKHYRHHYGPYSASLGLHLLMMSELLLDLDRREEARNYFVEAEKVLEVTHGRQHSLMLTSVQHVLRRCR